jgi:2-polyprenyl-6-methoxyphenol hydroxylase-like FAD-dependent oxidoreductase
MATSIDLALRGVRSVLLEARTPEQPFLPRTNQTNARSMEHFRRWGVADQLRENDVMDPDFARDIRFADRFNGRVLANFEGGVEWATRFPFASETPEWAPNPSIERTLRDRVQSLDAIDIRFNSTVTGFDQSTDGVTVGYEDASGTTQSVQGAYLVAADGSRSSVRRLLGVKMEGNANIATFTGWYIHAPELKPILQDGPGAASFLFLVNEDRCGQAIINQDSDDRYMLFEAPVPATGDDVTNWDRARAQFFRNLGREIDVTLIDGGAIQLHSLMAPRFDYGRVLLAGDAAHLISPMGGFGMNIGIGDAADLGWKLAAVLHGWGGERLLGTYTVERQEAETWLLHECEINTGRLAVSFARDGMEADDAAGEALRAEIGASIVEEKTRELISIGGQLGYQYAGSPIVAREGQEAPVSSLREYKPSSVPGCRAPHVWLDDDTSLYDVFGPDFTLLKLNRDVDTTALEAAAADRGVPLTVIAPEHPELAGLYETALALIRPDQHVAWRGDSVPSDPAALIDLVRGA